MESLLDGINITYILNELGLAAFIKLSTSRMLSVNHYYVLQKSLASTAGSSHPIKKRMEISPMWAGDIAEIRSALSSYNVSDKKEVLSRLIFHKSGFKNCYVIRHEQRVAYMQWIIFPEENEVIRTRYGRKFYPLNDAQVMIENAFTFPPYRGLGYLPSGTQQLLDLAREKGYRSAVCYIRKDNIGSLNEFTRMGFKITKMVPEYKVLGKEWRVL